MEGLKRDVPGTPFVPAEGPELLRRCAEVFGIQCAGLAKRIEQLPAGTHLNIGVSGGLDSTLAASGGRHDLRYARPRPPASAWPDHAGLWNDRPHPHQRARPDGTPRRLLARRSTSAHWRSKRSRRWATPPSVSTAGVSTSTPSAPPGPRARRARRDLTFENVQARLRTFFLMSKGFVVGTGDLSELALGWSTYNADHMSMYNPNCSIPKTLVKFLVQYVALNQFPRPADRKRRYSRSSKRRSHPSSCLSPRAARSSSRPRPRWGPYELHDFILFHAVRCGYAPAKILFLSQFATFSQAYSRAVVEQTMHTFFTRFFRQQYKRSCVPDGPKVGTVSLSPRGDWRMPSDADPAQWLGGSGS